MELQMEKRCIFSVCRNQIGVLAKFQASSQVKTIILIH